MGHKNSLPSKIASGETTQFHAKLFWIILVAVLIGGFVLGIAFGINF